MYIEFANLLRAEIHNTVGASRIVHQSKSFQHPTQFDGIVGHEKLQNPIAVQELF